MLNSVDFTKRLGKLLSYYELTASGFAEKIGVQRSSISHILSGRNKPSLDFVLKISNKFPEVNLYWLLQGTSPFLKTDEAPVPPPPPPAPKPKKIETPVTPTPAAPLSAGIQNSQMPPIPQGATDSPIERIVIFYKDGTFKNFQN